MATNSNTEAASPAALLDVGAVAALLNCGERTVYRLADSGRMPAPVKLGALVRWNRSELTDWIEAGCPVIAKGGDNAK